MTDLNDLRRNIGKRGTCCGKPVRIVSAQIVDGTPEYLVEVLGEGREAWIPASEVRLDPAGE